MSRADQTFTVKRLLVRNGAFNYYTYRVSGWIDGRRVRRQFKSPEEARGEKLRLEVRAANSAHLRTTQTRLRSDQLADAEAAVRRLGSVPISTAVDWYLANYRPPVATKALPEAIAAFLAEKKGFVTARVASEYRRELERMEKAFPGSMVGDFDAARLQEYLSGYGFGPKGWNNLRGYLGAFFAWCAQKPRVWTAENAVESIPRHKVARGIPEILTAARVAEFFAFLEGYAGGRRARPGCLVPYFALCTFAGLRPAVPGGEVWKLGHLSGLDRIIDLDMGVIRIGPGVAKTNDLRQVTIQPNLQAWLTRYPLKKYPLMLQNMQAMVTEVRVKFGLTHDVLRHTFISAYVAKFKSMGGAALEAGNSERIIRRHYYNLMSEAEAAAFWAVGPGQQPAAEAAPAPQSPDQPNNQ